MRSHRNEPISWELYLLCKWQLHAPEALDGFPHHPTETHDVGKLGPHPAGREDKLVFSMLFLK
jgi:hypothetical protein